jgi:hypothetical protein
MKTPILGGQYVARSHRAGYNRAINLYPEAITEGGKEPGFLSRCPGLKKKSTIGGGPLRGGVVAEDYAYIVSGNTLYKVTSAYSATSLGTIDGEGFAPMSFNGVQIMIACGEIGYIYNTSTGVLAQITDPDFPGATTVDYLDGYFIFNEPDSQKVWVTTLLDGTSVDPLEFTSAEGKPDGLVAVKVSHREAWLFGKNSIEIFYNSGALDFPLARISGAFIEIGCSAPYSIAQLDNSLFWLGADARGSGIVYRANGYSGVRVSDHSIEDAIAGFSTISDAIGYSYQQAGHTFYVLTFPTADRTFVFDAATGAWHERAAYEDGSFHRHFSQIQFVFNDLVHVGDYRNGNLYVFDLETYADDTTEQRWLRTWRALPTGKNNLKRKIHHQLQLDCQTGVGLNSGQGSNPQVMLRWSDDGGHNWSGYHLQELGALGDTQQVVIWKRLGMTRDRIYELSGTDPNKIAIMGAELRLTEAGT